MKKIIISIAIVLTAFRLNAQVGVQTETPRPNSVLDIESKDDVRQGVFTPRFQQSREGSIILKDAVEVRSDSLVAINNDGLLYYDVTSKCFRYYNLMNTQWWSLCGTPPPAEAEILDCYLASAMGTYLVNTPLTLNNYLQIPIRVSRAGSFSITTVVKNASNSEETYYFTASGEFPSSGEFVVNVSGVGEPSTFGNHTVSIYINGKLQTCNIPVMVQPRDPDYSIIAVEQLNPNWNILTPLNDGTYKVAVKLLVYNPGTWGLTTSEVNGYTFSATGEISAAQGYNAEGTFPQTVTVLVPVAAGQANLYGYGTDRFIMSTTTSKNASNCEFDILLSKGGYKLNRVQCFDPNVIIHLSSPTALKSTDTVTNGIFFVSNAYIQVPITVTAPGVYVCYADFAGVRFATCRLQGTSYIIDPVTLTTSTNTLTFYPIGASDNTNLNRRANSTIFDTPLDIRFSAGTINGPDGIQGNADDWAPESGYFQEDQFCHPSVVVKSSAIRYSSLVLADIAPTTGTGAYANGRRYSYDNRFVGAYQSTKARQGATQGVYTIDNGGNTVVTGIQLKATYTTPGEYNYKLVFGEEGDSIIYTASGVLPPIAYGTQGEAFITLTPFRKDADGNEVDINGQRTSISGLPPALNAWYNGVQINSLPATMPRGKATDIIHFYTSTDDLTLPPTGTLEVPIWFGYRAIKIVSYGDATYTLNTNNSPGRNMLWSQQNFGYEGVVPSAEIEIVVVTGNESAANIKSRIRDADIVLVQYGADVGSDANRRAVLRDFVNVGGSLMYSSESTGNMEATLDVIYSTTGFDGVTGANGHRFGIVQQPGTPAYDNDPILNGPFTKGIVTVTAYGEDNAGRSITLTSIASRAPNAKVLVQRSATQAIMFYDPNKGLLVCGDGGWLRSYSNNTNTSSIYYPLVTTSTWKPAAKPNYGSSATDCYPAGLGRGDVYNSYLFCNYLAWAIEWVVNHRDHTRDSTW